MKNNLKPAGPNHTGRPKLSMFADEIYPPSAGLAPALRLLNRLGLEYIDLRLINGYQNLIDASEADLAKAQRLLDWHNIKPAGLATPFFKCPLRGSNGPVWGDHHNVAANAHYQQHLDRLPRAFALAERFGTKHIRCLGFWREYLLDQVFDEVVNKLGHAAEIALAAGHTLYLKNEHNCIIGTGVELARVLRAINLPSLVAIYDDGNTGRIDGVAAEDYAAVRPWIRHINVKHQRLDVLCGWMSEGQKFPDQRNHYRHYFPWKQPDHPGEGRITYGNRTFELMGQRTTEMIAHAVIDDTRRLLQSLRNDGYTGLISVENAWDAIDRKLPIPELEAAIVEGMGQFAALVQRIWAEPPTSGLEREGDIPGSGCNAKAVD